MVEKIEVTKRSKVRRNNLSYLRDRSGKSARLVSRDFDRAKINDVAVKEEAVETKEEKVEATESEEKPAETKEPAEETKEA